MIEADDMNKAVLRKLFFKLVIIGVFFSLLALIFTQRAFAGSFSLGCAIMMINFYSLFHLMAGIFEGENQKAMFYTGLLMAKFLVLGGLIYVLNRTLDLNLMAFGLGFFIVAISAAYVTPSLQKE